MHLSLRRQQAEAEAEAIVEAAKAQARRVLEDAERQAEAWRQEGYAEGYTAGEAAARAQVVSQVQGLLDALQQAVEGLERTRRQVLEHGWDDFLKLSFALAEKIIRKQIQTSPDVTRRLLEDLLSRWKGARGLRIRCHPSEVGSVKAYLEAAGLQDGAGGPVEVVPAQEIAPGGCIVESHYGEIDARLETRLEKIADQLMAWDPPASGSHPPAAGQGQSV